MTTYAEVLAELEKVTDNRDPRTAVDVAVWFAMRLPIIRAALEQAVRPRKQVAWMATFGNNTRIYLGQPPTNERWNAISLYADISAEREE